MYRNGGDEFVVCMMGRDYERRQSLIDALQAYSAEAAATDRVSIAAGMAEFMPGMDTEQKTVYERADAAMFEHKRHLKSLGARTR